MSCPQLTLYTTTDVVGKLDLSGGNLALNGKTLRIRGTIRYGASRYLIGDNAARLEVVGKLASPISPGLTTYLISSQGVAGINCRNLYLRFGGGAFGQSLKTLWFYREDAVQLSEPFGYLRHAQPADGYFAHVSDEPPHCSQSSAGRCFTSHHGMVHGVLQLCFGAATALYRQ